MGCKKKEKSDIKISEDNWQMCSLLLTLLDRIEMETDDPKVLEITKQRMKIAEQMGLKVVYEGKIDSGSRRIQ